MDAGVGAVLSPVCRSRREWERRSPAFWLQSATPLLLWLSLSFGFHADTSTADVMRQPFAARAMRYTTLNLTTTPAASSRSHTASTSAACALRTLTLHLSSVDP